MQWPAVWHSVLGALKLINVLQHPASPEAGFLLAVQRVPRLLTASSEASLSSSRLTSAYPLACSRASASDGESPRQIL